MCQARQPSTWRGSNAGEVRGGAGLGNEKPAVLAHLRAGLAALRASRFQSKFYKCILTLKLWSWGPTPLDNTSTRARFSSPTRKALEAAKSVRGGMVWVTSKGTEYLARTTPRGAQTGLGRRDERTEKIHADFHARKMRAEDRVASLRDQLNVQVRLNRALRVGRMPTIAVRVLARLQQAGLALFLRTVGTHAMFAYETAAGVRLPSEVMTTLDIDLLFGARRRMQFAAALQTESPTMLELLRKVDKSFVIDDQQRYTLMNDQGFQVDFLRRMQAEDDGHPIKLGAEGLDDVQVVQARHTEQLMNAPGFTEIVVATNGEMARMDTIHPAAFSDFKRWMAGQPDRDPVKRRRDLLQAEAVDAMLKERLQHLRDSSEGPDPEADIGES